MFISGIAAVAENLVIGRDNDLIWHLPADMRFFKSTTLGHHVLMGRKNYESIPPKFRPLPDRTNLVITRDKTYRDSGIEVFHSVEDGIKFAEKQLETELFIIGGAQIFHYAYENDLYDQLYITHIHHSFEGDAFFPDIDFSRWKKTVLATQQPDEKHKYGFTIVKYNK